ncbi:MAG TPA: DUF348 domain-containing protein [Candidatus Moranbacteria bacterium]|nr:DUF348 domain-containing protein [Candidatus Moranbacteria bacterium]
MIKLFSNKKIIFIAFILISFLLWRNFFKSEPRVLGISTQAKHIFLNDNGLTQQFKTNSKTIQDFLEEQQIVINRNDFIYPPAQNILLPKTKIEIHRAKKVSILVDDKEKDIYGFGNTVIDILQENNIKIKKEDIVKPSRNSIVYNDLNVKIIRVEIKKETKQEKIKFKTIYKKDKKLSWRKEKIKQKGISGIKEITYQVSYHNNKEVDRKIIETKITKKPIDQVIIKGSYIKFGKSHKGVASWYAYTGTLSAANPWLPMGSYVKVTNLDNGKSVIVKINDRGPFGNGRIIDLDKVAFSRIANVGQGTANIKMEEILN